MKVVRGTHEKKSRPLTMITVAMEHGEPTGGRHNDNDLAELMPRIVSRGNMLAAYQAVKRNAGAAGVDEMSTEALSDWVRNR